MSKSDTLNVRILDKEYCINCPAEERTNLQNAARYLDDKMREIRSSGKVVGVDRIAVMAALNISHELLSKQRKMDKSSQDAEQYTKDLLERIDSALQSADWNQP